MTRHGDTLTGTLAVRVDLSDTSGAGFAEARVTETRTATIPEIRAALYDLLVALMDALNVELEYQIKRRLRHWVVESPEALRPPS